MNHSKSPWLMWSIAVAFFSFQFVLRLFPGLIVPEIMAKFHMGATAFGILSGAYYLGYAGLQIPVGLLLDRYSPRYIITGCAFLCGLGTLSFIYSESWYLMLFGRFLIGAGSAAGFLGTAKTIRLSFPEKRFTGMIGLTFTVGLLGALYGGRPVSVLIDQLGWVRVLNLLAFISFAFSAGVFLFFPKNASPLDTRRSSSDPSMLQSLFSVFKNRKVLWIGLAGSLMVGPLEGFADIWGVSYLINVYGFSKADASLVASCIFFGMLFGGPVLSFLAERFNAYYSVTALCGLIMATVFGVLLATHLLSSKGTLMVAMTLVGVLSCYQAVVFAIACKLAPPHLSGLATSVTNCMNMCAGCFFHFAMGWIMDQKWSGVIENGVKIYDEHSYTSAISVIPITLMLGFFGFLFLKRTESNPSTMASGVQL